MSPETSKRSPFAPVGSSGMTPVVLAAFATLMMWAFYHPSDSTDVEQGGALGWCLSALGIAAAVQMVRVGHAYSFSEREPRAPLDQKWHWLVDGIVGLLAVWIGYSAIAQLQVGTSSIDGAWAIGGDWRAASNEAWVWIVGAVWFVVLRRSLRGGAHQSALLGLIVVGGVLLATHALHQVHVSLPQTLREYNADPDRVLAEVGISAPEGSNARMIFENRLRDGGPTATFALANTLAGLLAMALVVVIAVSLRVLGNTFPRFVVRFRLKNGDSDKAKLDAKDEAESSSENRGSPSREHLAALIGLVVVASILMLALKDTQSRAGMLSVLIVGGCVLLDFIWATPFGRRAVAAMSLVIAAMFAALPLAARGWFGTGWIGLLPESVRYRFQYWDATWRLVEHSPWTGAGPGNYQQAYHRFRLPESHEIIADPHHFVAETLGAGGLPAGLLLIVLLAVASWMFWRVENRAAGLSVAEPTEVVVESQRQTGLSRWSVPVGAAVGWLAVWVLGIRNQDLPDFDAHLIAVPLACAVGWLWWFGLANENSAENSGSATARADSTMKTGWDVRRLAWFALMAGLLHLSFSGGWTVPGIAVVLWTLAAIVLSPEVASPAATLSGETQGATNLLATKRLAAVAMATVTVVAAVALWMVSYRPVAEAKQWMADADVQIRRGNLAGVEKLCERAMAADTHAFDPAMFRLHAVQQAWLQRVAANGAAMGESSRFKDALQDAIQRAGNDPSRLQAIGELVLHRYQVGGDAEALGQASAIYDRCGSLSPMHQGIAAQRAVIAKAEGGTEETIRELAEKAVELAEAGGVVTRKLSLQFVLVVRPIGRSAIQQPVRQSAQEAMDALRL
ncbi:MAG: O-antigen ligase family protein [Rhodopirellula bahusiensis]